MSEDYPPIHLSALEEERFGVRTARASLVSMDDLPPVLKYCDTNNIKFLIARCPVSNIQVAQAMEKEGFALMDTLVYYARSVVNSSIPSEGGKVFIRPFQRGEEDDIKRIAAEAFRGYASHYHADERLDKSRCDEVYTSWAFNSCVSRDVADDVFVAELDGSIAGFATMLLISPEEGQGPLFAVAPPFQGRGILRSLLVKALEWCRSKGVRRMIYSTQITNIAAQKALARTGFEIRDAYYTFHKWFDRP